MGAKAEKVAKVRELTKRFGGATGAIFTEYRGLTVKDAMEVRGILRAAETRLTVSKNTLTRIAARDAGLEDAIELLEGPTAIAFIDGDPIAGGKALMDDARRFPAIVVKGAVVEGRVFGAEQAQALATLDTREVSLAKVAGLLRAPLQRIAYVLQAPLQRLAYALAERGRQGQAGTPEASEATEVSEPPEVSEAPKVSEVPEVSGASEAEDAPEASGAGEAATNDDETKEE